MSVVAVPPNTFRFFAKPGSNPGVAGDTPRVLQFSGNPFSVSPRIVEPENAPPASLSYVEHIFANAGNLQLGADGHKFLFFSGSDSGVAFDGLRIGAGQLSGSGYKVSAGHYLEEGVVRLDFPFTRFVLGNHSPEPGEFSRGVLDVVIDGTVGRFRIGQVDDTEQFIRQEFGDVDMPIGDPLTPGTPPEYAYFHFYRRFDSGAGIHRANLTINTTAAAEQTSTYGTPGDPGTDQWSNAGVTGQNAYVLWMRAGWNDSISGPLGNTPWATPRVHETTRYQPHGDYPTGWIDGGAAGRYWHNVRFTTLVRYQGSRLRLRATALDTVPNASLDGLWDARPWIECTADELNLYDAVNGYPQGRYLLLQLEFIPSTTVSLAGSTALFYGAPSTAIVATHSAAVPPLPGVVERIPYSVRNSEGQALVELPVAPVWPWDVTHHGAAARFPLEDGRARSHALVTKARRTVPLRWPALTTAKADELQAFFDARAVGDGFLVRDPEDNLIPLSWRGGELSRRRLAPNMWGISEITVEEIF